MSKTEASKSAAKTAPYRHWNVTVTPKVTTYAGSQTFGESAVRVYARTRADAIKEVRQARRAEDGRFAVPATYRATAEGGEA